MGKVENLLHHITDAVKFDTGRIFSDNIIIEPYYWY